MSPWYVPLCTGFGQPDTHAPVLSSGRLNTRSGAGKPYGTITLAQVVQMAQNPPTVDKMRGQWVIPSQYHDYDARSHKAQRAQGLFHCLPVDLDQGSPSLDAIKAAMVTVVRGAGCWLAYTSPSAAPGAMKWRVILPLATPVPGFEYRAVQRAFFDLLRANGLMPDPVLDRAGQLVFLPNRGAAYTYHVEPGPETVLDVQHPIIRRAVARKAEALEEARNRPPVRTSDSALAEITWFNERHAIADLLVKYGYEDGGGDDWRSPYQEGSSYATRDYGTHWVSLSTSDERAGVGRVCETGCHGDAFDLFLHFGHRGVFATAMREIRARMGLESMSAPKPTDLSPEQKARLMAVMRGKSGQ